MEELDKLRDLVYWERFALHLPQITQITQTDIDIIKRDNPLNTTSQKQALSHKWLQVYSSASWELVILALEINNSFAITKPVVCLYSKLHSNPYEEMIQDRGHFTKIT